jgi:hypothetical protein
VNERPFWRVMDRAKAAADHEMQGSRTSSRETGRRFELGMGAREELACDEHQYSRVCKLDCANGSSLRRRHKAMHLGPRQGHPRLAGE